MELDSYIEAILFFKAEPVLISELAKMLNKTEKEIQNALLVLNRKLENRGIVMVNKDDEVILETAPEAGTLIEGLIKEELSKDLGKAGLETLAIVLYHSPIARTEIDYIRGVNSNFILRNLLVRGLVERITNPSNQRSFLYKPSFELLAFMGVKSVEELPEYDIVKEKLDVFYSKTNESENMDTSGDVKKEEQ